MLLLYCKKKKNNNIEHRLYTDGNFFKTLLTLGWLFCFNNSSHTFLRRFVDTKTIEAVILRLSPHTAFVVSLKGRYTMEISLIIFHLSTVSTSEGMSMSPRVNLEQRIELSSLIIRSSMYSVEFQRVLTSRCNFFVSHAQILIR